MPTSTRSANAETSPAFNRRQLAASLALAPAGLLPTAALARTAFNVDAELLALREPYNRTLAGIEAVGPAHSRAEEAAIAMMQAQPGRDRNDVEREVGLDVAEARWDAALDANGQVVLQIIDTPARSICGLAFKALVSRGEDNNNLDLIESLVADILAMGGVDA